MTSTQTSLSAIDDLLREAVDRDGIPGVAALAADRDGVLYRGAAGRRLTEPATPMTTDSVLWLGSMTKMIVAIHALQLVERGQLQLDAPMGELLPALADVQVLSGFDDEGQPVTRSASTPVTLRNLLNHTAGNGYHFWHADVLKYQEVMGLPGIIECREATLTTPLVHEPGSAWVYGMNIDWVGKAIEAVTGGSLEESLRRDLLDPLGMADTSFVLTPQRRQKLGGMNVLTPDGRVEVPFEMTQEPEFQMAGGAMYGSPEDYLVLLRMLLAGGVHEGRTILSPAMLEEALANQIGDLRVGPIPTVDPGSSHDVDFLPQTTKTWSLLGMRNEEDTPQGRTAGSLFWAGLGNTYFWVDYGSGDCGVLFTQILPFADPAVLGLLDRFEAAVHRR